MRMSKANNHDRDRTTSFSGLWRGRRDDPIRWDGQSCSFPCVAFRWSRALKGSVLSVSLDLTLEVLASRLRGGSLEVVWGRLKKKDRILLSKIDCTPYRM